MANHQQSGRSSNGGHGDGFTNSGYFADNAQQHFPQAQNYDNFFTTNPADHSFPDPQHHQAWSVSAGFPNEHQPHLASRAVPSPHAWHQQPTPAPNSPQAFPPHANTLTNAPASQNYPRSLSQSPAPFAPQQNGFPSYGTPQQQQYPYQAQQYDPPLFNTMYPTYGNGQTIAPQALNQNHGTPSNNSGFYQTQNLGNTVPIQPQRQLPPARNYYTPQELVNLIPQGQTFGTFTIIDETQLGQAIPSQRADAFANIAQLPVQWPAPIKSDSGQPKPKTKGKDANAQSDSNDSDDSSLASNDEEEPLQLKSDRPGDLKGQATYDSIKAVWRPRNRGVEGAGIRKGMADFWDVIRSIRDNWKIDKEALAKAQEEKTKASNLAILEGRAQEGRGRLEAGFRAAQDYGHPDIVAWFSSNDPLMYAFYQVLLDRMKADDYNGGLARAVLEIMSRCATLTDAKLEKVHLVKVLSRYSKNANAKIAGLAKRILAKAAEGTKADAAKQPAAEKAGESAAKEKTAPTTVTKRAGAEAVTGTKRPASTPAEGNAAKKVATVAAKVNGSSTAAKSAGATTTVKKVAGTGEAAKVAVKKTPVAKAGSGFFASLQSAAKKPGTSIKNTTAAGPSKPAEKKDAWSLTDTLNSLSKAKEKAKVETKPEKEGPPETEEERAKRLRKEARSKLRVRFKPEDELVQIRHFAHHPEEEEGHDDSQKRDVSDRLQEGLQLKMGIGQMDEEDEDEEEPVLVDFRPPPDINFANVVYAEGYSAEGNYEAHAGSKPVKSEERDERERQNRSILQVHYMQESDIPPNPREPAGLYSGTQATEVTEIPWPEQDKVTPRIRRMLASWVPRAPVNANTALNGGGLGSLLTQHQQNTGYGMSQPTQPQVTINSGLASALEQLRQLSTTSAASQAPQALNPALMGISIPQPVAAAPATAPAQVTPDISAILASLQQAGQIPASQPATSVSAPAPPTMQSQAQQFAVYENNERKRMRESEPDEGRSNKRAHAAHSYSLPYKTKTCRYWRCGKCDKGDNCTFAHEDLAD